LQILAFLGFDGLCLHVHVFDMTLCSLHTRYYTPDTVKNASK